MNLKKFFSEGFKRYFFNTSWLMLERLFRIIVGIVVTIYVTRYLGPKDYGHLAYAISYVGLFLALVKLGLSPIVTRDLVNNTFQPDVLLGTSFWLKVICAVTTTFLIWSSIKLFSIGSPEGTLIFIISIGLIFQSFNVIDFFFQAQVQSKYVVWAQLIQVLLSSVIKIFLVCNEYPLIFFAYVALFDTVILALGLIVFYWAKNGFAFIGYFNFSIARRLLKTSWPLILSGVVVSLYLRFDQLMIKAMMDSESVGSYAAAVMLCEGWYFLPVLITQSLFTAILKAKSIGEQYYLSKLQDLYNFMAVLAFSLALPTTFIAQPLVTFLYGEKFSAAAPVLMISIWTSVFVFLGSVTGKWYIAENLIKKPFYRTLLGITINIILNLIMIPIYGIKGAAMATLISHSFSSFFYDAFDKETRIMFIMKCKALFFPCFYMRTFILRKKYGN